MTVSHFQWHAIEHMWRVVSALRLWLMLCQQLEHTPNCRWNASQGVWPGLDGAVHHDGCGELAGDISLSMPSTSFVAHWCQSQRQLRLWLLRSVTKGSLHGRSGRRGVAGCR